VENQAGAMPMEPVGPTASGAWKKPWIAYNVIDKPGAAEPDLEPRGMAWLNRDGSINVVARFAAAGRAHPLREDDRERRTEPRAPGPLAVAAQDAQE